MLLLKRNGSGVDDLLVTRTFLPSKFEQTKALMAKAIDSMIYATLTKNHRFI